MIRFTEAVLVRFGKFTQYSLPFSDGVQVIYGKNEAGKSTIQLFVKVMLYGISGAKKDGKGLKLRERIIPWQDKSAEGILRLLVDGRSLEIRRRFGKTAAGDKTEILDSNTGEPIDGYDSKNLGEQLLGIPESVFEKTLWLQQEGAFFSGTDEELNQRLMNLLETGAEDISIENTLEELLKESRNLKAKDKRSVPGELDRLWNLREEKIQERYLLLSERKQRETEEQLLRTEKEKLDDLQKEELHLQECATIQKQLLAHEEKRKKWEEGERLLNFAKQAESRDVCKKFSRVTDEVVQKAEILEKQIEILDQTNSIEYDIEKEEQHFVNEKRNETKGGILLFVGIGLIVFASVFAAFRVFLWILLTFLTGILGIVLSISGFTQMKKAKNEILQSAEMKRNLLAAYQEKQNERNALEQEYQGILESLACKNAAEIREGYLLCKQATLEAEGYRRTYASLMAGEDFAKLSVEMEEAKMLLAQSGDILSRDIETELFRVQQAKLECVAAIKETESKISYVYHGGKNPADTETEILQINQKIDGLEKRLKALRLAMEVFQDVAERRKSDFTPQVNARVNAFLGILTGGKYQDVRVSDSYQLRLLPDKVSLYPAEFFSTGTYEQVYFALRLALANLLGDGTEPLFLDDFLVTYDDERGEYAMELLEKMAENRQILFFSCHSRELQIAKKRNIEIRYLEEEGNDGC